MLSAFTCQDGTLRRTAEPLSRAQWIDLLQPTSDEIGRVTQETGLAIPTEANINEIESSSRLATREGDLAGGEPMGRDLVEISGRLRGGDEGEPVVSRTRLDVTIATGDVAERARVNP